MEFGICTGCLKKTKLEHIKKTGFDYFETNFRKICALNDTEFEIAFNEVKESGLPCLVANSMLPSSFKIGDVGFDYGFARDYLKKGFARVAALGVRKVVFGSGGARSAPKGADKKSVLEKVREFLKIAATIAAKYNITIVIEPLSPFECNLINTIKQSADLAQSTGAPNVKAHADFFHMKHSGDDIPDIYAAKDMIEHSHISNPRTRMFPKKLCDSYYGAYIEALSHSGCKTCSVEGFAIFFNAAAKKTIKLLAGFRKGYSIN